MSGPDPLSSTVDLLRWYIEQLDSDDDIARDFEGACWHVEYCGESGGQFHERFDPTRARRDIAAKRRVASILITELVDTNEPLDQAIRILAEVYAERDGYQESWRPSAETVWAVCEDETGRLMALYNNQMAAEEHVVATTGNSVVGWRILNKTEHKAPPRILGPHFRVVDGRREIWDHSVLPGGWVCGERTDTGSFCCMPVESEPCEVHHPGQQT